VCHDFSDSPDAPFFVAGGRNQFCVPQGIELALNGKAQVDSGAVNIGGGRSEGGAAQDTSFIGGVGKGTKGAAASPTAANDDAKSGGCSMVGQQGSWTAGFWMMLIGLSFFAARRRNRSAARE